ncbi:hypothetical protein Chor_000107 [Crotalus horridus]
MALGRVCLKYPYAFPSFSDLILCTNDMNVNIPQLADSLFERTTNSSWVVVFKSLITTHHLMVHGNERFTQYLASRNTLFNLSNFLDKSGLQGYDMSTFIRRYSRYLNEKAVSYRQVAFDFTKVKRGADGVMRTMNTEKLLKMVNSNELTNGVINAAFMLLFKDAIRLFAAYNEGIINLLEKYFDMKKNQCKEALDIYKKFLTRMARISEFLKVAEEQRLKELAKKPHTSFTTASSPVSNTAGSIMTTPAIDIFATPSSSNSSSKLPNDLLDLQPAFHPGVHPISSAPQVGGTWGDPFTFTPEAVDDAIPNLNPFLTKSSNHLSSDALPSFTSRTPTHEMFVGFDELGGLLKPTVASQNQNLPTSKAPPNKLVLDDLDSSLANLVGNLGIGNGTPKKIFALKFIKAIAPPVMAYPATTPTGIMGYGMPSPMGGVPVMTQPTLIYSQPVMRPPNPFGPISGAQVGFNLHSAALKVQGRTLC